MIHRRDLLKSAGSVAAATVAGFGVPTIALCAPSIVHKSRHWIIAIPQSLDTLELRTLAARVTYQLTASLFDVSIVIETNPREGMDAVCAGTADIYIGVDSEHASIHPALGIFAGLPLGYGLAARAHRAWLLTDAQKFWRTALDAVDVVTMPIGHTGPSPGLYADIPIHNGGDLRGVAVAARGFGAEALRFLGASLSAAEPSGPLAEGGIVAAEPLMAPFETRARWAYQPGLTPAGLTVTLGMRGSLWRGLSDSDKATFRGIADETSAFSVDLTEQRDETLARVADIRQWPSRSTTHFDFERDIRDATRAVIQNVVTNNALAHQVFESHRRFANRVG